jgi:hypothetical protein
VHGRGWLMADISWRLFEIGYRKAQRFDRLIQSDLIGCRRCVVLIMPLISAFELIEDPSTVLRDDPPDDYRRYQSRYEH